MKAMRMADEHSAESMVKPPLTEEDVRRLAREIARDELDDLLRRLGIPTGDESRWRSFFAEVNPVDARRACEQSLARMKVTTEVATTLRNEGLKYALQGLMTALVVGLIWYLTAGGRAK